MDALKKILVLTRDPENIKLHRRYISGGQAQQRRRPGGKRAEVPILIRRKIGDRGDDFGWAWAKKFNNHGNPSVNQLRDGIANEAKFLIR